MSALAKLATATLLLLTATGSFAAPVLRGIAETVAGEKFEGWIHVAVDTLFVKQLAVTDDGARLWVDGSIDFNWGTQPPMANFLKQSISVRWEGEVVGPITGKVTFYTKSDDGVRLWVAKQPLADAWRAMGATEFSGELPMEAGKRYPIRLEYFQDSGPDEVSLSWSGPSLARQ